MKKIIITVFAVAALMTACSTEGNTTDTQPEVNQKSLNGIRSCSSGEKLLGTLVDISPGDIRGRDCKGGLGLCTPKGKSFSFSCMSDNTLAFDVLMPSYDQSTNLMSAVAIEGTGTIRFYFHKDIVNSPDLQPGDLDYFDITDISISGNVQLLEGMYPKQTEGDYLLYEVDIRKI